ncbi:hypothetical protein LCGC14_1644370 [marine sediment metagenome]|uniref:Uncharacterized protein n=1 Tax=marine sediment metagenome TaxID=412755 RepID=A0A0F9HZG5_9ZZZZ
MTARNSGAGMTDSLDISEGEVWLYFKVRMPRFATNEDIADLGGLRAMADWFVKEEGAIEVISWGETPELIAATFPFLGED